MQFENEKCILSHGIADLRKGALGLLGLIEAPERDVWYLFSNRSRTLVKCIRRDRYGTWAISRKLNQGQFPWIEKVAGFSVITPEQAEHLCQGKMLKKRI